MTVEPKVMDVLRVLTENVGQVVSREALIDEVWGVEHGGDERLSRAISLLRKALADTSKDERLIETAPRRGYRLTAEVSAPQAEPATTEPSPAAPIAEPLVTDSRGNRRWLVGGGVAALLLLALAAIAFFPGSGPRAPERSLAVLPFIAMSAEEGDVFFAEGLSEELLNVFSQAEGLKLASRTSSFAFAGRDMDIRDIGDELGVAHVLEGSIRRSGTDVRVTAQLISVEDGYHLWSQTYDRSLDDIFLVQDEIARRVAEALNSKLPASGESTLLFDVGTKSPKAYDHYAEARTFLDRRGSLMTRAQASFEAAIEADPTFAEAHSGLAVVYVLSPIYQNAPKETAWLRAREAADRALSLDPSLSEPYAVLGAIEAAKFNWAEALTAYADGESRNPEDVVILQWQAELLSYLGYLDRASEKISRAIEVSPDSGILKVVAGNIEEARGNIDGANTHFRQLEKRGWSPVGLAIVEIHQNDIEEAARTYMELTVKRKFVSEDDSDELRGMLESLMREELSVDAVLGRFPTLAENDDVVTTLHIFRRNSLEVLKRIEADTDEDYDSFYLVWTNVDPNLRAHPYITTFLQNTGMIDFWDKAGWPDRCNRTQDGVVACR
nr:winged helix-turn-helix domain-containing protein [Parvularcula mediterranea]